MRTAHEATPWVPRQKGIDHDVLIVGAGQSGIAAAFALRRQGIEATIIDAEQEGGEGVWLHRARMHTLRTPKDRPGPELAHASLSFRHWHTEYYGEASYDSIERIPRTLWARYLTWFRTTLAIPVRFATRLIAVQPNGQNLTVTLDDNGRQCVETTRKLVLACGLTGGGTRNIPAIITNSLPPHLYAHTDEPLDVSQLTGKRIAILGASASGFDIAATALEANATTAHLYCRAPTLTHGVRYRWADYPGADYFHLLPDSDRWRIASLYTARGSHPPPSSVSRCSALPGFHLHLAAPWTDVAREGEAISIATPNTRLTFDFVIAATGFIHDPTLSPELSGIAAEIALWQDRYTPPAELADPRLARYPYLGPEFQYQPKTSGTAPHISNIHVLNTAAMLSHLRIIGDIKFLQYTSELLARGIVRDLFLADWETHLARLASPPIDELTRADYDDLVWTDETGDGNCLHRNG